MEAHPACSDDPGRARSDAAMAARALRSALSCCLASCRSRALSSAVAACGSAALSAMGKQCVTVLKLVRLLTTYTAKKTYIIRRRNHENTILQCHNSRSIASAQPF